MVAEKVLKYGFYDELVPLISATCLDASTHLSSPDFLQLQAQLCRPSWAFQEITKPAFLTLASFQEMCLSSSLESCRPLQYTLSRLASNTTPHYLRQCCRQRGLDGLPVAPGWGHPPGPDDPDSPNRSDRLPHCCKVLCWHRLQNKIQREHFLFY